MKRLLSIGGILAYACALWGQGPPASSAPKAGKAGSPPPVAVAKVTAPFKGDLDALVKRRLIRVLTPYSKTGFFVHGGVTRGIVYDVFKKFETDLNLKLKTGNLKIFVMFIPTPINELAQRLIDGNGDILAAPVIITEQRRELLDFTTPTARNISEVIVTGPGGSEVARLDDLSGKSLYLLKSWAYWKDMEQLSARLVKAGKAPVKLIQAPDGLEPEDLLEMVNAGIVPATAAHDYLARFWAQVLPNLKVNPAAAVKTGGEIAWAIRKGSPKLKAELDAFIASYPENSALRSVVLANYLKSTKFAKAATSATERAKLENLVTLFQKYGDKYGMDYLLMAAQGYQESALNQAVKSPYGAIGVMQVMPPTGKQMNVGDITKVEPNIHAGVKFIRFMMDQYYGKEPDMTPLNKELFTFASYNAGPARIAALRKQAAARGLNPNVWFNNVEVLAAEKIGRETVTYVSNIYKYYLGYRLLMEQRIEREKAKEALKAGAAAR